MRTKFSIAAVLAVVLVIAGVTLASARPTSSAADRAGRVIKLVTVTPADGIRFIDHDPAGPSLGDEEVFTDDVYDESGQTKLGVDGGVCTIVRLEGKNMAVAQCVVSLSLAHGQVTAQGLVTFDVTSDIAPAFEVAITGGTGEFEGAGGHVTVEETSATRANLTLHLILPDNG
ncbi:MAG: hypothetical protein QOD81_2723 [Solirubrobacteraceae bacterium]|nr:hypothetical protein [Solirubrobacteraceae bacterium]